MVLSTHTTHQFLHAQHTSTPTVHTHQFLSTQHTSTPTVHTRQLLHTQHTSTPTVLTHQLLHTQQTSTLTHTQHTHQLLMYAHTHDCATRAFITLATHSHNRWISSRKRNNQRDIPYVGEAIFKKYTFRKSPHSRWFTC